MTYYTTRRPIPDSVIICAYQTAVLMDNEEYALTFSEKDEIISILTNLNKVCFKQGSILKRMALPSHPFSHSLIIPIPADGYMPNVGHLIQNCVDSEEIWSVYAKITTRIDSPGSSDIVFCFKSENLALMCKLLL